jgi:two-component system sensor histidine kinase BarA
MTAIMRTWRDLPLGTKLASLASLLVLVVVLALTYLTIEREQVNFHQELESQAHLLLETLALTMRDQLYRLEIDELIDIARVVGDNENVTLLKIYDSDGALLVDSAQDDPVFSQETDPLGERLADSDQDEVYLDWQDDQLVAGRSIWLGRQQIGAVAVGLSTAPLDEKIEALTFQALSIALVTLVVGIGLTFLFSRQITNPLSNFTEVAAEMADGVLATRVQLQSRDEVGQLGSAFNQMADAIEKRETDLRDLAAGLERTVEERTAELRERNRALLQANDELRFARREAEEATQLKSQFLAAMSHELRTPLSSIMGYSQLLLAGTSGALEDKQSDKVDRIFKSAQSLLVLINDLLDLAKIEAGRTEILRKPFGLSSWLHDITHQLEGLAEKKDLKYTVTLDEDLPMIIVGDPIRLKQVADNLISNAIKFTEEGKVTVNVRKENDDTWSFAVIDTGIGIPSHALEYIFDEFRQVDGSTLREHGGTGLGLAIVRNLVVMMGGKIRVSSTVGEGSKFSVHLPLVTEEEVTPSGGPTSRER